MNLKKAFSRASEGIYLTSAGAVGTLYSIADGAPVPVTLVLAGCTVAAYTLAVLKWNEKDNQNTPAPSPVNN